MLTLSSCSGQMDIQRNSNLRHSNTSAFPGSHASRLLGKNGGGRGGFGGGVEQCVSTSERLQVPPTSACLLSALADMSYTFGMLIYQCVVMVRFWDLNHEARLSRTSSHQPTLALTADTLMALRKIYQQSSHQQSNMSHAAILFSH